MLNATTVLEYAILAEKNLRSGMPVTTIIGTGLDKIIELCRQEILEQSAKEVGGSTLVKRIKTAQKMMKGIEEYRLPKAGAATKSAADGSKYQTFNNGYFGFILYDELQGLPQGDPVDALDMGEQIRVAESQMNARQEMEVDLAAIKAHIALHRAEHKGQKHIPSPVWKLGNHSYNAQYILDCFTILGGDVKFYNDPTRPVSGAVLESENGKAALLPLRNQ